MFELLAIIFLLFIGINYATLTPERAEKINQKTNNPKKQITPEKIGKLRKIGMLAVIIAVIFAGFVAYDTYILLQNL